MKSTFDTIVAGVTKNNAAGKDRQKIIENYIKDDNFYDKFDKNSDDYWSPQDIKESNWEVYQYDLHESNTIELIPEPDNPYDKNAIKVIHKEMGDIGYIPKKDNVNLANFINSYSGNVRYSIDFEGGKYKYYDGEKIITDWKPYGIRIYVNPIVKRQEENKNNDLKSLNKNNTINYSTDILSNQEETIIEEPKKDEVIKKKESDIKYLIICCFGLLVSIMLLMLDAYFVFMIMMILSMLSLRFYFKPPKEDKKWKKLYLFLLW